jgi:hypothetical protein
MAWVILNIEIVGHESSGVVHLLGKSLLCRQEKFAAVLRSRSQYVRFAEFIYTGEREFIPFFW